jgi:hypothetical protein
MFNKSFIPNDHIEKFSLGLKSSKTPVPFFVPSGIKHPKPKKKRVEKKHYSTWLVPGKRKPQVCVRARTKSRRRRRLGSPLPLGSP